MSDIVRRNLTEQQEMAAYYMALGMAPKEIAEKVGTTTYTVNDWKRNKPAFKEELQRWKDAQNDQFGVTLVRSQLAVLGLTEHAANVLEKTMNEVDEDGQPTSRAIKAAIEIMRKVPLAVQGSDDGNTTVAQAAVIVVKMDEAGKVVATDDVIDVDAEVI